MRMEWAEVRAILRNDLPPQLFPTIAPKASATCSHLLVPEAA